MQCPERLGAPRTPRVALLLAAALLAASLAAPVSPAQARSSWTLRYGFEAGQTWHAVQTAESETTVAGVSGRHQGTARIRYDVVATETPGEFRLDARMLSQETQEGASPLDFSVIRFMARTDARGTTRGMHFVLDDEVTPPELPGMEADPAAFRQMLRAVASAWIESVYWLPTLPERPLSVGESFVVADRGDVGGTEPGVRMEMQRQTTYRLRKVTGRLAEFAIEERSTVGAATTHSGITSRLVAEGEAVFDLDAGMWRRQEVRSQHEASLRDAQGGTDQASARTVTTIEMRPGEPS